MQNISLGHLVHEAADRMMVDEEDRKFMTNVIKRGALKDEVFLVAHTVGNGGKGAGGAALGDIGRSQPVADPGSQAETVAAG